MASAEQLTHATAFLQKAEEYLASAEDNLIAERPTAAAGDAIHAGISAKGDVEYGTALLTATTAEHSSGALGHWSSSRSRSSAWVAE